MIFKQIYEVLTGRKTQTRRLVKIEDHAWRKIQTPTLIDTVVGENVVRFQVGKDYAVQPGRGEKSVGRIRITNIRKEHLSDISEADAIAEGVGSISDYRNLWDFIYEGQPKKQWLADPHVWVITFECIEGMKQPETEDDLRYMNGRYL